MSNSERTRVTSLLASPKLVWWIMALTIALGLPTLDIGLLGDDLLQYGFLHSQRGEVLGTNWWNMFALVEGPRERNIGLRTAGHAPWWIDPDLRVVFFRPLTVLTHHVDHWLWPQRFWLMHMHNVLWHAAACGLSWVLARRLASNPIAAGLAALVYTLSFSHVVPAAWLAHRNGLVSTTFALASLIAHDAWRRDSSKLGAIASPILLLLALLGAEAGVVAFAFLVAHAVFFDDAPWPRRLLGLLPALLVILGWRAGYDAMHFGAVHSGAYLDPVRDPLGWLAQSPGRYLWLLSVSVSPPAMSGFPPLVWLLLTIAVASVVLVYLVRVPSRTARFGALAVVLGCVPLTASLPGDRLLILTSFGTALLFGELLVTWLIEGKPHHRAAATIVLFVHVLIPVVAGPLTTSRLDEMGPEEGAHVVYAPSLPDDGLQRKGLVIVHAPNYVSASQLPQTRLARGLQAPNFLWLLYDGHDPPDVHRLDDRTLELRTTEGWPASHFSAFWRSPTLSPFEVGDTVKTLDYVATVKRVESGKAMVVEFRFRTALEHPSFAWVMWTGEEFEPFVPRDRWPIP